MKPTVKRIGMTLLTSVIFISAAAGLQIFASPSTQQTPSVDRREGRQKRRIKHGVNNGSLTRHETNQVVKQQKRIRAHEKQAKADGTVTARERASLQRQENRTSRNIYRKKHNNRTQ